MKAFLVLFVVCWFAVADAQVTTVYAHLAKMVPPENDFAFLMINKDKESSNFLVQLSNVKPGQYIIKYGMSIECGALKDESKLLTVKPFWMEGSPSNEVVPLTVTSLDQLTNQVVTLLNARPDKADTFVACGRFIVYPEVLN